MDQRRNNKIFKILRTERKINKFWYIQIMKYSIIVNMRKQQQ